VGLMIDGKPADEFGGGRKNNIARTGVDTTKRIKLLNTNVTPMFLEYIRHHFQESEHWSWKYPLNTHFSKRHPKLTIIDGAPQPPEVERLAGLSMALFTLLYEQGLNTLVYPKILWCGASIKDKHRKDNIHTDHDDDIPKDWKVLKVLGCLNSDWKEEWGGGFTWNDNGYYAPPGSFYVFDPLIPHAASDIFCDEKRIAIDYTLRALPEKK
tara:strand:+ start:739 stop:1371 length:633 start_codon:yes stop_codon:yes gene_type:complete